MNFFNIIFGPSKMGHSKVYETFLHDYFTGHSMIRGRREEDTSVWDKLKGGELEAAKLKIIDNLDTYDESYIRAAGIFRDARAIEPLKEIADKGPNLHLRLYAAKTLHDWVGFDNYVEMLETAFDKAKQFTKTDLAYWIHGLDEEIALKFFWKAMNDADSFVRYCAYGALEHYYGIGKFRKDGFHIKYYTDEEVYQNKELFEQRQAELKEEIKSWKFK
ncbi:MAG: HEAT repeat domain-containing protein [Fluviicola sp.]